MTKEGALLKVKGYLTDLLPSEGYDEVEEIIKALKQTDTLDEIRAEIDDARFIDKDTKHCKNANASGLEIALQIIDKYKEK